MCIYIYIYTYIDHTRLYVCSVAPACAWGFQLCACAYYSTSNNNNNKQ